MKRTPLRRRSVKKAAADKVLADSRLLVAYRSGGRCEVVGCQHRADQVHHIKPRSHGVDHSTDNLLHVCRSDHERIHVTDRAWAITNGYLRS